MGNTPLAQNTGSVWHLSCHPQVSFPRYLFINQPQREGTLGGLCPSPQTQSHRFVAGYSDHYTTEEALPIKPSSPCSTTTTTPSSFLKLMTQYTGRIITKNTCSRHTTVPQNISVVALWCRKTSNIHSSIGYLFSQLSRELPSHLAGCGFTLWHQKVYFSHSGLDQFLGCSRHSNKIIR